MTTTTSRPIFDPVDTTSDLTLHAVKDDVESPSLSDSHALARFEFEPGKSKDGTKVLMVEWEDDEKTRGLDADWEVSWEGKRTVFTANEQSKDEAAVGRLYFLLGPGVTVPTQVRLRKGSVTWRTNPLPAIFAAELGATARQAGKKGVLHTIWAKKRLQVLQDEIDVETRKNTEGMGLEMAVAEKEWIEQNFGVAAKLGKIGAHGQGGTVSMSSPVSPRSPGGGRLMDKLKGLKLGTSSSELGSGRRENDAPNDSHNPLSPESSDVAVGSFGSFAALKGAASDMAAEQPQVPQAQRRIVAQRPPDALAAQQRQQTDLGSLDAAFASTDVGFSSSQLQDQRDDDDLFALPMSPRSPEMTKSPFSFAAQDTQKYAKSEKA
ncbi:hypothetical protein B0A50_05071 [Salinomyces thailandicus]|uniref:Uncharacterized protein n=1 Tax=Salinomyces thailandicus TaxID=706561 RepID=A0A4U0TW70_9PEZI|nr:hypothetical protein B0A50_05071 [Salinomyces thailandica]